VAAEQIRVLAEKITRARTIQQELEEHRQQYSIFHRLAEDLQNDHFQAYRLEETLTDLVRGASQHLARLTSDRYGLDFVDDEILVIDHDNASERRSTDTLSGGETFLASLALALELSSQVQQAVGAVRLYCLFIDEGIGTLDPETLRTVGDAVQSLRVGGRMVGIITHIPELKEEFDQKVIVEKEAGCSQVRIECK
jgi:exonuclease SbcC